MYIEMPFLDLSSVKVFQERMKGSVTCLLITIVTENFYRVYTIVCLALKSISVLREHDSPMRIGTSSFLPSPRSIEKRPSSPSRGID